MRCAGLLLALALAACGDAAPAAPEPTDSVDTGTLASPPPPDVEATRTPDSTLLAVRPRPDEAPTPFDRATVVFDTLEPLPPRVEIQPRPPTPPPEPQPAKPPVPDAPATEASSGSCDVRSTESFCFSYTGTGWTRSAARSHCADAPDSAFRTATCPSTDAIGTCRFFREDAPAQEILYTYYAPYALALAELACPGEFERIEAE